MPVPSSRDADQGLAVLDGNEHPELAAARHRLQSVGGEIPDDLSQLVLVGVEPHRLSRHVDLDDVVLRGLRAGLQQRRRVLDGAPGVDAGHVDAPGPGIGQKRRDRRVQPVGLPQHDVHELRLLGRERQLAAQDLHRARHRRQRVADLVGDAGGHLADGRQPLAHLRRALEALDVGHVLEGEDDAALAAAQRQRRGADAELDRPAVGALKRVVDATGPGRGAVGGEIGGELLRQLQCAGGGGADDGAVPAGDRRRGAIGGQHPTGRIHRQQSAGQVVDDVAVECLEVGNLLGRRLDHDVGAAQVLGQLPGQEGHREECEHVGAHGDAGDVARRQQHAVGRRRRACTARRRWRPGRRWQTPPCAGCRSGTGPRRRRPPAGRRAG